VTGLGRPHGRLDRLEVTHLADEDHVGVLTQGPAEGLGEARDVVADLALVDDRLLVVW
jgi:predicted alpha/beta-hydrolase family hydrolase